MARINFITGDYNRRVADAAPLMQKNRYFEQNPVLSEDGAALLARPGMRKLTELGSGPIRGLHSAPGAFGGDMFVASGAELYRLKNTLTSTAIFGDLFSPERGVVNMAITGSIGTVPEFLFVADGAALYVYDPSVPAFTAVEMPENVGAIDVTVVSSYVIVIPTQEGEYLGRFYWIQPGEKVLDPLNFATAERSPDGIYGVEVFGDQFWLPGGSTTEVWYPTGDPDAPMRKLSGVVLDRGSWENTATAIHESLMLVDNNGGVFMFQSGTPVRVSTPDIEEEIRRAISLQQSSLI